MSTDSATTTDRIGSGTAARELAAEGIGTSVLLFVIVASGIVVERGISELGLQLAVHGLAVGVALGVLIAVLAPYSGAHFNPAVTLGFLRTGSIAPRRAVAFVGVQLSAALVGVGAANLVFGESAATISTTERSGLALGVSEFVGTFVLVFVILALVRGGRSFLVPAVVGGWVAVIIIATPSTGFVNPAVTFARMFTDTFTGIRPTDTVAFIAVQCVAAVVAAALATWFQKEAE